MSMGPTRVPGGLKRELDAALDRFMETVMTPTTRADDARAITPVRLLAATKCGLGRSARAGRGVAQLEDREVVRMPRPRSRAVRNRRRASERKRMNG